MTNLSNGQSFQVTVFYSSSQTSAEWIVERPILESSKTKDVLSPLANFGAIKFSECKASFNFVAAPVGDCSFYKIEMYSSTMPISSALRLTEVSELSSDKSAFTVNYLESG